MVSKNMFGSTGRILRVDLGTERIWEEALDEGTLRMYVGGSGLGAKFLYDEVKPGIEWDSPENRLVLASGPLGGPGLSRNLVEPGEIFQSLASARPERILSASPPL